MRAGGWYDEHQRSTDAEDITLGDWVVQRRCPHLKADLTRFGVIDGDTLTCQLHGWSFDLPSGFATGGIAFIKLIGVGMIVAIVVDATLVRALLVPATMRLFGRWNWWAPGPLARIHRRYGIREGGAAEAVEPADAIVPVGR